jgi:hypothetical protein
MIRPVKCELPYWKSQSFRTGRMLIRDGSFAAARDEVAFLKSLLPVQP